MPDRNPRADAAAVREFFALGRTKLEYLAELSPGEIHQSLHVALLSQQTGVHFSELLEVSKKLPK